MDPLISEIEGAEIRDLFHQLYLTTKTFSEVEDIIFTRSMNNQPDHSFVVTDVKVTLAEREVETRVGGGTRVQLMDGSISREIAGFPMEGWETGDTFSFRGAKAWIAVVYPEMNRVVRADFQMQKQSV